MFARTKFDRFIFVENGPPVLLMDHGKADMVKLNVPWALLHRDPLARSVACRHASNIGSFQPREVLRMHGAQSSPSSKTTALRGSSAIGSGLDCTALPPGTAVMTEGINIAHCIDQCKRN